MDDLIRGYGAIGLMIVGLFLIGSIVFIESFAAQGLVALFGLGVVLRGGREYRKS
ncbi:hypothetical protein [Halovenus sp. HT40]|uniref:hypothetical protein n=1 Tax=Halovenus sp. HT40 TaxID=3126691 RepID=UPI00300E94A1